MNFSVLSNSRLNCRSYSDTSVDLVECLVEELYLEEELYDVDEELLRPEMP